MKPAKRSEVLKGLLREADRLTVDDPLFGPILARAEELHEAGMGAGADLRRAIIGALYRAHREGQQYARECARIEACAQFRAACQRAERAAAAALQGATWPE